MARAKRHYIPGQVWHIITHRCHKKEFLLKFPRDRRRWIEWLYQAKKKYSGLTVLNYMVTSNHIGGETKWTQSIAIGSEPFVERMKESLGFRARGRKISRADDSCELREALTPYDTSDPLDVGNTILWDQQSQS
jgi:hypothetical protein